MEYILDIIKRYYEHNNVDISDDEDDIITVSSNGKIIFTLDSNALYREFVSSKYTDLEEYVLNRLTKVNDAFISEILVDYRFVKEHIYISVINADKNHDFLEYIPYVKVCDLAIVYCFDFNGWNVTNDLIKKWGISKKKLHEDAVINSKRIRPKYIEKLSDLLTDVFDEEQIDTGAVLITNRNNDNGASVLFYPGVIEEIGEMLDGNFYIIPASINEMLAMSDNGNIELNDLYKIVGYINKNELEEEYWLSDHIYYYNWETNMFEIAM